MSAEPTSESGIPAADAGSQAEAEIQITVENQAEEKQEAEEAEIVAPRRSSRISAKPAVDPPKPAAQPAKRGAAKKRTADDIEEEAAGENEENGTETKKAKATKAKKSDESTEGITLGEALPDLVVKSEKDEDVNVKTIADDRTGVVLFLVPKADTPGCTQQACGFRDIYPDFQALNFAVFCLSADSPSAQTKWQTKKSLPYPLLSDPKRELIAVLTGSSSKTPRSHFVFVDGKLADKKMPVKPADSPRLALEFIKTLVGTVAPAAEQEAKVEIEATPEVTSSAKGPEIPDVEMNTTDEGEKLVATENEKALPGAATAA